MCVCVSSCEDVAEGAVAGEVYIIYGLIQERKPHSEKGRFAQEISRGLRVSFSLRSQYIWPIL